MATATVVEFHGKYYKQNTNTRLYTGSSASAGIALIAPAAGGGHPTLWNPSDSTRWVSLVKLELSYVTGDNAPTAIEWALTSNTGASTATGSPIATATLVAPVGILGGAVDNKARWSPTTNTFTAAPVFTRPTGLSLFTGVATTAVAPFTMVANYDGDLVLAPGTAISLCAQAATTTATFQVSVTWEEGTIGQA